MRLSFVYNGPNGEVRFDSIEKIEEEIAKTKAEVERGPLNLPVVVTPYQNDKDYKNFLTTFFLERIETVY